MKNNNYSTFIGAFFVFLGAVFFSGKAVLVKLIYIEDNSIDHVVLLALRMGLSLPFFITITLYQHNVSLKSEPMSKKEIFKVILLAFGGYYLSSVFDFWGLEYISASLERLILFIYPTIVVILSSVFLKRKLSIMVIAALLLTYFGVAIVLYDQNFKYNDKLVFGSVLIFLAAITYASYLVGSERMILKIGNLRYTSLVMSFACVFVLIHFVYVHGFAKVDVSSSVFVKSIIMAIFCTVIPSFLISEGIKRIGSANASIIASIGPVTTIMLSSIVLGEKVGVIQILGTILVLGGVILASLKGRSI